MPSWSSARILTAKCPPSVRCSCSDARLSMQANTSGGSNETDENALTVMPAGRLSMPNVVTTVTPLMNRLSAVRNSSLLTGIDTTPRPDNSWRKSLIEALRETDDRLLRHLVLIYQLLQSLNRAAVTIFVVSLKVLEYLIVQLLVPCFTFR